MYTSLERSQCGYYRLFRKKSSLWTHLKQKRKGKINITFQRESNRENIVQYISPNPSDESIKVKESKICGQQFREITPIVIFHYKI